MIKKIIILLFLCLIVMIGGAYFILWPLAQQYLEAVTTVLRPAVENVVEPLQVLPPAEVTGIGSVIAILPVLEKVGIDTLNQISELTADGVTIEEAQQALDILRNQLSAEELAKLLAVFNLQ